MALRGFKAQVDPLPATAAYSASSLVSVDLPRDGLITHIEGLLELTYDVITSPAVFRQDAVWKALNSIRIEGTGGRMYAYVNDARLLHYLNLIDYKGAILPEDLPTAVATGVVRRIPFVIHPGLNPLDPYDTSAMIPAERLSSLVARVQWPANSVLGTNATITTATLVRLHAYRIQGFSGSFFLPKHTQEDFTITQTYTDLGKTFDLPIGSWLRRTLVMVLDNAAAPDDLRNDTRVTEVGLILPRDGAKRPLKYTWHMLKSLTKFRLGEFVALPDTGTTYAAVSIVPQSGVTGIALLDWTQLTGNPMGLDLTNAQKGDVQIGLTIGTANGVIKILHEQFDAGA